MPKKRARLKNAIKPKKANKVLVFVVAIIVIAVIALFLTSPANLQQPYIPAGQGENYKIASTGDGCTRDLECFLANCKSTPDVVKCINATAQDFYYVNCNGYVDVKVVQDISSCKCVQGFCTKVK